MLAEQADDLGFNRYMICNLHALLSDNRMQDTKASGRLRFRAVGIGRSVFYPLEGPQRIEARFLQALEKADVIHDPFERAFFAMVHLPYLQPFEDVNKRVSRLSANIPLIQQNLCPLSFVDVEQSDYVAGLLGVYELNRVEMLRDVFVWAYRRSCQRYNAVRETLGELDPFRLRRRLLISECVQDAVAGGWHSTEDSGKVVQWAEENRPADHRDEFATAIRVELEALHEGNIARYRLRPHQFQKWKGLTERP